MIREDLSDSVIHLTKGTVEEAHKTFVSIAQMGVLQGGSGFIRAPEKCVCFTETPLSTLSKVLANNQHSFRYRPFGVVVSKNWLHKVGGRPVIYQPDAEYVQLTPDNRYRHVRYEPPGIDFTWEREWRIKIEALALDPAETGMIVPDHEWEERFMKGEIMDIIQEEGKLPVFVMRNGITKWRYVVLEDLGVRIKAPFYASLHLVPAPAAYALEARIL